MKCPPGPLCVSGANLQSRQASSSLQQPESSVWTALQWKGKRDPPPRLFEAGLLCSSFTG